MKKTELAVRLTNACTCVSEAEDILTEIDSKFGDADHGLTMTKIAKAISQAVAEADGGIQSMLDAAAMAVMMLNGGSAVPLWNTWLDGMQEAAPASDEVDVAGLKAMFAGAFTALDEMSGAKVGDKTMMDALIPKPSPPTPATVRASCSTWPPPPPTRVPKPASSLSPNSAGPKAMGSRPSAPPTPGPLPWPTFSRASPRPTKLSQS